jgi:hypothetical protein
MSMTEVSLKNSTSLPSLDNKTGSKAPPTQYTFANEKTHFNLYRIPPTPDQKKRCT